MTKDRRRVLLPAIAALALVAGCSGGLFAGNRPNSERIEIGDDIFGVTVRGRDVEIRNYATGAANQARLFRNAEAAAVMATGCDVARITQRPGFNVYDARLDCR